MAIEFQHGAMEGITVPYPPIADGVRNNRGFVDLRGRPDLAAQIVEGSVSISFQNLLVAISSEGKFFSLGCDLGRHTDDDASSEFREVAGGYFQFSYIGYSSASTDQYDRCAEFLARRLRPRSRGHKWQVNFVGCWVQFKLTDESQTLAPSLWLWFFASAATRAAAEASRESLIDALRGCFSDQRAVLPFSQR